MEAKIIKGNSNSEIDTTSFMAKKLKAVHSSFDATKSKNSEAHHLSLKILILSNAQMNGSQQSTNYNIYDSHSHSFVLFPFSMRVMRHWNV